MHRLKIILPEEDKKQITRIVDKFMENGFECYLVGGSVRDLLMDHEIYDFDFATNALPGDVIKMFRRVIPTGIKHGTVSVLSGKHTFEITTYRSDGKYIDGRRPESVHFSQSLEEDVKRRDFTINGLAYDVKKEEVIDFNDGLEDIKTRVIRTIGDPIERFSEDGLRTYRACRFAAKLNFEIAEETFLAIGKTLHIAQKVSVERVRDEFNKLLEAEKPSVGIEYLRNSGLLDLFLPELAQCHGIEQNRFHVYDIYYHSIYSCDAAPRDQLHLRLASLLHDIGKVPTRRTGEDDEATFYNHEIIGARMARRIMKRLKYSNEAVERVSNLIVNHMFHYTDDWTDGAVRRFIRKVGLDNIDELLVLRLADRRGNGSRDGLPAPIKKLQKRIEKIIEAENAITVKDLKINGYVLMEKFALDPGPIIGKILHELLEAVLDDPDINTEDTLIAMAENIITQINSETGNQEA